MEIWERGNGQDLIRLAERPKVYRTYGAGGELFGWAARRFPEGSGRASEWVAHARGARYVVLDGPPEDVREAASRALKATGLWESFGCVDLLRRPNGEWLEVVRKVVMGPMTGTGPSPFGPKSFFLQAASLARHDAMTMLLARLLA